MRTWDKQSGMNSANFVPMFKDLKSFRFQSGLTLACLLFAGGAQTLAQVNQTVYTDSLQNGWDDWSWSATRDFVSSSQYHSGSKSISVSLTAWGALSLHHADIDTATYTNLTFWIHGGTTGGQQLRIYAELGTSPQPSLNLPILTANTWQQVAFSLAALGVANQPNFARFSIQDATGTTLPTFYVDDITLVGTTNTTPPPPPVTNTSVAITVNAALNQHPINPLIYGVAFAGSSALAELNAPLNRSGGNAETRYNWQLNAHNRGADWFFESIPDNPNTPAAAADNFVASSQTGGAQPILTIPMIGWVPKLTPSRSYLASYSITKYGPQTAHDTSYSAWNDFGNGIGTDNTNTWLITTNDAARAARARLTQPMPIFPPTPCINRRLSST